MIARNVIIVSLIVNVRQISKLFEKKTHFFTVAGGIK